MKRLILLVMCVFAQLLMRAQCTAPANFSHYSNGSLINPIYTVHWNAQVGVDSYIVYYQFWHSSAATWGPSLYYNGTGYSNTNMATLSNLGAGNFVQIIVSPKCLTPAWSYYVIELPCPTVFPSLASNPGIHSLHVAWNPPWSGAVGFYAEHRKLGDSNWIGSIFFASNIYPSMHTFNNLLANTWYQIRIVIQCGESVYAPTNYTISPILLAKTANCEPPDITNITNIQCNSAFVYYTPINYLGSSFQFTYWAINDSANSFIQLNLPSNQYGHTMSPLSPATTYKVRIRSMCSVDSSIYADTVFTTLPASMPCLSTNPYGSVPVANGFTVSWSAVTGAAYYELQYRKTSDPPTIWTQAPYTGLTLLNLTGLAAGTSYTFRLRVKCTNCNANSPWSSGTYGTLCAPPLTSSVPSSNLRCDSALIRWSASPQATSYYLQYKKTADVFWTSVSTIVDTFYMLFSLETGKSYMYKVGTHCSGGSSTIQTNALTGSFSTLCPPSTALSANPANTALIINWIPTCGITQYDIEYRNSFFGGWTTIANNFLGNSYTLSGPGIQPASTLDIKVISQCDQGGGTQSTAFLNSVTLACLPPNNILHSMTGNQQASISWDVISGASQYELRYRNADASGSAGAWVTMITNNTLAILNNLLHSTNYDVSVKTKCFDGNWGNNYSNYSFKTPCPVISGLQISTTTNSALIKWAKIMGVYSYKIQYGLQNSSGQVSSWQTFYNGVNDTSLSLNGLMAGSNYSLKLQTKCSAATADTSITLNNSFTTLSSCSPPALVVDSVSHNKIFFSWNSISGANVQQYRIRYKLLGSSNWDSTGLIVGENYSLNSLLPAQSYQIQIKSLCGSNPTTGYSNTSNVNTIACPTINGIAFNMPITFLPLTTNWQDDTKSNSLSNCFTNNYSGLNNQNSPDIWYSFVLSSDDTVEIKHCNSAFANTYLHLLNASGVQIAVNNNNGPLCPSSQKASIRQWLTAGTYFIVSECNSNDTGSITTSIRRKSMPTANVQIKLFLQGYYLGSNLMSNVLYNAGVNSSPSLECDSIEIQLRQDVSPYSILNSTKTILSTNGMILLNDFGLYGQSYYIAVNHRNSIETWSANPVQLSENTYYDFSTNANKAYGNNMKSMGANLWAFYSGDINQDDNIDLADFSLLEFEINQFNFGYFPSDMNGDGNIDLQDVPILEGNINAFVFASYP